MSYTVPCHCLLVLTPTTEEPTLESERKLRLEASMKIRALNEDRQRRWKEFRDAEKQRRVDKANQQEMDRLNAIIAESRARREYTTSKFEQTLNVRSHDQAAVVIQRAFRRAYRRKVLKIRVMNRFREMVGRKNTLAAIAIQRWWRKHLLLKAYRAMHFRSIMTGPVVAVGRRGESPPPQRPYEREIAITGNSHHACKMNDYRAIAAWLENSTHTHTHTHTHPHTRLLNKDSSFVMQDSLREKFTKHCPVGSRCFVLSHETCCTVVHSRMALLETCL